MRTLALMTIAAVLLLVGTSGCCKSLSCAAHKAARLELDCETNIELSDVTSKVRAETRAGKLPPERGVAIQRAKGCARAAYLECALGGSGALTAESARPGYSETGIPPEFADPQWRCWPIADPLGPPRQPATSPADPAGEPVPEGP